MSETKDASSVPSSRVTATRRHQPVVRCRRDLRQKLLISHRVRGEKSRLLILSLDGTSRESCLLVRVVGNRRCISRSLLSRQTIDVRDKHLVRPAAAYVASRRSGVGDGVAGLCRRRGRRVRRGLRRLGKRGREIEQRDASSLPADRQDPTILAQGVPAGVRREWLCAARTILPPLMSQMATR